VQERQVVVARPSTASLAVKEAPVLERAGVVVTDEPAIGDEVAIEEKHVSDGETRTRTGDTTISGGRGGLRFQDKKACKPR
jgi:hypothetical protein